VHGCCLGLADRALCKLGLWLLSWFLSPSLHGDDNEDREEGTQHNGGTVSTGV